MIEAPVAPSRVRYIKLGEGGRWAAFCIEQGLNRVGFGTSDPARFALCLAGRWDDLVRSFIEEGRGKGTASLFANELKAFFTDDGTTLWITFHAGRLWWAMSDDGLPAPGAEGATRVMRGGWRDRAIGGGERLDIEGLSGALTKLAMYRGTSCEVDVADYVVRRINGQKTPEVEQALAATKALEASVVALMRLLTPKDFELLVDLVFSTSGWRRLGTVGKTQETVDIDLVLPSTGQRAFVQVKSKTGVAQLADYAERFADRAAIYDRMFYVYHSGAPQLAVEESRVTLVGPEALASMVLDAGLARWLINKTS